VGFRVAQLFGAARSEIAWTGLCCARLHEEQRQSWTISSFFLRMPRRVSTWLPQWGQASGCFVVSGTPDAGECRHTRSENVTVSRVTKIEK
jgi:hypothetical protein